METAFAERHIRSLVLAKTCAELGARVRTIAYVTGLNHTEVVRLFFVDEHSAPRGRPPESADWFDNKSNLLDKVEASIFVALFARIRALGFGPADALVGAYKHYREKCGSALRISFDRGFDLVCNTYGIWLADKAQLTLTTCRACHFCFLTTLGDTRSSQCHFCKLLKRYHFDRRVQAKFPPRALPAVKSVQFGFGPRYSLTIHDGANAESPLKQR